MADTAHVNYQAHPSQYRHWRLQVDDTVATLSMDVSEDGGIREGYKLKLNSYDLGVDIELHDAVQRIRFEHPRVRVVVLASAKDRVFCSGANIFMLGQSSHGWKVNFCKFTNETRNGLEDSSRHSGLKFISAVNGACAGGGYELALACDEILLVDDRSTSVSLPELPLLGVLPGTGGLTRMTDKRHVRHDLADVFCSTSEGVRGQRAKDWRLVDEIAKPAVFAQVLLERIAALSVQSERPASATPVILSPLHRRDDGEGGVHYGHVHVVINRARRHASLTVKAPLTEPPPNVAGIEALGAHWWPLAMARELDDAILHLRTNEPAIGTWILKTAGDPERVLAVDASLLAHGGHWLVRETVGLLRRTLARLDVSSRSLFALIEPGSCFAGVLAELAFCADRSYMVHLPSDPAQEPKLSLTESNLGLFPMVTAQSRLARRFYAEAAPMAACRDACGRQLTALQALDLGLVTAAPDDLDWGDEVRLALEERAAISPDALTGLEANLRFCSQETMETRIFGRLSAWQNWIFVRPNASGPKGSLNVYGKGEKAAFDFNRV